jgi:hypothetical protein
MKRIRKNLKENQREWIRARVEELRKEGHSDNYIRQTIRGQIAEVGLNMDAKIYNRLIELYLKKK